MCFIVDNIDFELCDVIIDECGEDEDCKGGDKCCDIGCIKECVISLFFIFFIFEFKKKCLKFWKGFNGNCESISFMCVNDKDCIGLFLCCFDGCE